jgi:hypothetical protein
MFNTIVRAVGAAAGVASRYGSGSDQMMRLRLCNTDFMDPEPQRGVAPAPLAPPPNLIIQIITNLGLHCSRSRSRIEIFTRSRSRFKMMRLRTTATLTRSLRCGNFFLKMGNFGYKKLVFVYFSNFKLTLVTKCTYKRKNCSRNNGYARFFLNALAD